MTNQDTRAFAIAMATLGEVFGTTSPNITETRIQIYFDSLSDLTIGQVQEAVRRAVNTMKFFPKPSELRELVCGDLDQRAEAAIRLAEKNAYFYESVGFQDQALMAAIENTFATWARFCQLLRDMPEREWTWRRKEFKQNYKDAVQFGLKPFLMYFPGQFELGNQDFPDHIPAKILFIDTTGKSSKIDRKLLAETSGKDFLKYLISGENDQNSSENDVPDSFQTSRVKDSG